MDASGGNHIYIEPPEPGSHARRTAVMNFTAASVEAECPEEAVVWRSVTSLALFGLQRFSELKLLRDVDVRLAMAEHTLGNRAVVTSLVQDVRDPRADLLPGTQFPLDFYHPMAARLPYTMRSEEHGMTVELPLELDPGCRRIVWRFASLSRALNPQ